jgi:hypothetical protein
MSIDTLEQALTHMAPLMPLTLDHDTPDAPAPAPVVVQPALLAGEEREAPDPCIFRGTD